jgi:hypothetical protein
MSYVVHLLSFFLRSYVYSLQFHCRFSIFIWKFKVSNLRIQSPPCPIWRSRVQGLRFASLIWVYGMFNLKVLSLSCPMFLILLMFVNVSPCVNSIPSLKQCQVLCFSSCVLFKAFLWKNMCYKVYEWIQQFIYISKGDAKQTFELKIVAFGLIFTSCKL